MFDEAFDAHDALEDVIALRRILFSSRLSLTPEMIVNNSLLITLTDAAADMRYIDNCHKLLQTFSRKLYNLGHDNGPVKQNIAEKIAGSGLSYEDLLKELIFMIRKARVGRDSGKATIKFTFQVATSNMHS